LDISTANIVELAIAKKLSEQLDLPVQLMAGNFPPYDMSLEGGADTWEVKFEATALKTKNFCFERSCNGNPSGITATQARWWIHSMPSVRNDEEVMCYEFAVSKLRKSLEGFTEYAGGDRMRSRVKLLPVTECEKLAVRKFTVRIPWGSIRPYWKQTQSTLTYGYEGRVTYQDERNQKHGEN
jgi:hypothetical protein